MSQWETVIGLEIHAQLSTKSKIFSGAATTYGAPPNTQACAIDLALPGVLPVLNGEAVRMAALFGLAIGATIASRSIFARKNYFYPDLPKGYQISQYELPLVSGGSVEISLEGAAPRRIGVTRAHLEEDAGKSLHDAVPDATGIDLNRAGTPLVEIVSEPDMRSSAEAVEYMRKVHSIVRYLGICDGNMQEGSFRCDANVSVRLQGTAALGTRTEIKNLNSFRFVERAIEFERSRQIDVLEDGGQVIQETRLFDPDRNETRSMRNKEEANDYRYFPDPDLLPVCISEADISAWRAGLPELPDEKRARFELEFGLGMEDAMLLTSSRELAEYYEATLKASSEISPQLAANWVTGDLIAFLKRDGRSAAETHLTPLRLGRLLARIADGTLAKHVFAEMWKLDLEADRIIEQQNLRQVTDSGEISTMVDSILDEHPQQVREYQEGSQKLLGFFIGRVMKRSNGKANPQQVNELLAKKLGTLPQER